MSKTYEVPVSYTVWGTFYADADSIDDLKAKLQDKAFVDNMRLPEEPCFVDGSYQIDWKTGEFRDVETGEVLNDHFRP